MSYGLVDFLHDLQSNNVPLNEEIYGYFSQTDLKKLAVWIKRLERVRSFKTQKKGKAARIDNGRKSNLVGRVFEKVVRVLLDGCKAFHHDGNIRSTTSEIDFRILIDPSGAVFPMLSENGTHAIGEAKCVTSGLKSEWFTELSGILSTHNATLAILFTASPSKKLTSPHRTTLAILAANNHRVVPVGLSQLHQVLNGENFLQLLSDQYVRVLTHSTDLAI